MNTPIEAAKRCESICYLTADNIKTLLEPGTLALEVLSSVEGTTMRLLLVPTAGECQDYINTMNAEAEYLTECPSCGEGPSETGFPRMDEDGLCACCGMDCSILGTVEAFKENEAQVQALTARVAEHAQTVANLTARIEELENLSKTIPHGEPNGTV